MWTHIRGIPPACNPRPAHPLLLIACHRRLGLSQAAWRRQRREGTLIAADTAPGWRVQQNATLRRLKQNEAALLSPSSSSQPRAVCSDPECPRSRRAISSANRVRAANATQHPFTFRKDSLRYHSLEPTSNRLISVPWRGMRELAWAQVALHKAWSTLDTPHCFALSSSHSQTLPSFRPLQSNQLQFHHGGKDRPRAWREAIPRWLARRRRPREPRSGHKHPAQKFEGQTYADDCHVSFYSDDEYAGNTQTY